MAKPNPLAGTDHHGSQRFWSLSSSPMPMSSPP